jgi:thiamine biosynthesis protein ThiS
MKIICNGKEMEVKEGLTIEGLILNLKLNPEAVVVECDGKIVLRGDYGSYILPAGASLELIRFVGGG